MNPDLAQVLKCLRCGHSPLDVEVEAQVGARIMQGHVRCPSCAEGWPIVQGVPRLVTNDNYARSFGEEWGMFSRTQLDSHTGTTISYDRFIELTQTRPEELKGKRVLECGCGMGRFIEVLAKAGADVVGVDYSSAVDASFSNLRDYPNVTIIQADLFNLPFEEGAFDFVFSNGVLHHTPDTKKALFAIAPYTKAGGVLSVWVYHKYKLYRPYQLYRYLFRRLPADAVLKMIRLYHPIPWFLRRIPIIGKPLSVLLPVADYRGRLPLRPDQQLEWSYLDTVDALTPWYEWRHTPEEVKNWFEELGYQDVQLGPVPCSVKGQRPLTAKAKEICAA